MFQIIPILTQDQLNTQDSDSLIVLDQLIEAEQDAQPPCTVVRLQIEAYLVHDGRPFARIVVLDHVVDASCQLDPEELKGQF